MTRRKQFWTFMVAAVVLNWSAGMLLGGPSGKILFAIVLANAAGIALFTAGEKP